MITKSMKSKSVTVTSHSRSISLFFTLLTVSVLSGCSTYPTWLPSSGPSTEQVQQTPDTPSGSGIQIVDVNDAVARKLLASQRLALFSETFSASAQPGYVIGAGDVIEVSVWEAPPAALFGSGAVDPRSGPATTRVTALPEQMVNSNGRINIPFAGQIVAAGRTPQQIETDIVQRLKGKFLIAYVMVSVFRYL